MSLLPFCGVQQGQNNVSKVKFSQQVEVQTGPRPEAPREGSDDCCLRAWPKFDPYIKNRPVPHCWCSHWAKTTPGESVRHEGGRMEVSGAPEDNDPNLETSSNESGAAEDLNGHRWPPAAKPGPPAR